MRLFAPEIEFLVGIDEVGRGPLAGPLMVGAVCVRRTDYTSVVPQEILDSKRLSPNRRQEWANLFQEWSREGKLTFRLAAVSHTGIDRRGIGWAIRQAVSRAVRGLNIDPQKTHVFLDGALTAPSEYSRQETIIGGDAREPLIGMASIMAKVARDRYMTRLARKLPVYGFDRHKGYGTPEHVRILLEAGPSEHHRRSFLTKLLCS